MRERERERGMQWDVGCGKERKVKRKQEIITYNIK
jgi:hypothetical protein